MKQKNEIDVVDKVLEHCYRELKMDHFIMSLMHQYEERRSLSKKQLQGLYYKAEKVKDMPANLLATLEAKILKMPNRFKSEVIKNVEKEDNKNEATSSLIQSILDKYPAHKRVLFFQSKFNHNEELTTAELKELEKFAKALL